MGDISDLLIDSQEELESEFEEQGITRAPTYEEIVARAQCKMERMQAAAELRVESALEDGYAAPF